jgi:hypothetical protein
MTQARLSGAPILGDTAVAETLAREAKYSNPARKQRAPKITQTLIQLVSDEEPAKSPEEKQRLRQRKKEEKQNNNKKKQQFAPQSRRQLRS